MQLHVARRGWAMLTVAMTASIGLAVLSFELAEKRILRLKEGGVRLEYFRSKPASRPTSDTPACAGKTVAMSGYEYLVQPDRHTT